MSSESLLIDPNSKIRSFEKINKDNRDLQLNSDSCKDFMDYIWLESNGKIPALTIISDTNNTKKKLVYLPSRQLNYSKGSHCYKSTKF